jgi:putative membrane protein
MSAKRTVLAIFAIASMAGTAQAAPLSTYVMKAGAGDLYEIMSSKLALQSTNPKVKSFASMMVDNHTKSIAVVKAAATRSGLKPKPLALTAKQKADIAALKASSGADRDALYLTQQKAAHREALALHKNEAAIGSAAPLKSAAKKIVPIVEKHISLLDSM